jgi:Domain of unknown function (DUF4105)
MASLYNLVDWLAMCLRHGLGAFVIGWAALAIYYATAQPVFVRVSLACAFTVFGLWAVWFETSQWSLLLFSGLYVGILLWWLSIRPSHNRIWRADVRVMPQASIEGDRVRVSGVRNFEYRTREDFTERYEEREVSLSHLRGIDFYISYWMAGPVGHTFLSFVFDDAPPLCISIEARPEIGEGYAPVGSLFKQFELIYVVGNERDIVRVRTNYRGEQVYLYQLLITPETARQLFRIYLQRLNALAAQPEFYHLLSNSCTVNIVRYAKSLGRGGSFNIRHYLNGLFDGYLYNLGQLDTTIPFEELRRRSRINDAARAADGAADFSARIRASLPRARRR